VVEAYQGASWEEEEEEMSALRTAVLLGALSGLLVGLCYLIGGPGFAIFGLIFAGLMNFGMYWFSDKLALRMAGANEVTAQQEPQLHALVEEVAQLAGLPKPKVFVVQNESPNAFATGRNPQHAVVAVTTGIMRILDRRELKAVIGHEMGHVKNRDILISTIAATIAGAISYIQTMLIWGTLLGGGRDRNNGFIAIIAAMVGAVAAAMLQMAISRTREFAADKSGAEYVHDPEALASALSKLHNGVQVRPMEKSAGANATSSLYIVHPFRMEGIGNLFATHPPIEERIRRLRAMAGYGEWR
jgi:heat shock protein HtpX